MAFIRNLYIHQESLKNSYLIKNNCGIYRRYFLTSLNGMLNKIKQIFIKVTKNMIMILHVLAVELPGSASPLMEGL